MSSKHRGTTTTKCARAGKPKRSKDDEPKPSLSSLIENKLKELEHTSAAADARLQQEHHQSMNEADDAEALSPHTVATNAFEDGGATALQKLLQSSTSELHAVEKEVLHVRRKLESALKEKEVLSSVTVKNAQLKQRLELACRDLQKQNKLFTEEVKAREVDEEKRQQEISSKLKDSIDDIATKMDKQGEDNQRMAEENAQLKEKLAEMKTQFFEKVDQYKVQLETRATEVTGLQEQAAVQRTKTEEVGLKVATLEATITQYKKAAESMEQQVELYKARLGEFRDAREQSAQYLTQTADQRDRLEKGVEELAKQRDELNQKRVTATKEKDVLVKETKDLKRVIASAEQKRRQKEKECRALQQERARKQDMKK
eukprot:PhM_4_TR4231/c0_g1_i1/m.4665